MTDKQNDGKILITRQSYHKNGPHRPKLGTMCPGELKELSQKFEIKHKLTNKMCPLMQWVQWHIKFWKIHVCTALCGFCGTYHHMHMLKAITGVNTLNILVHHDSKQIHNFVEILEILERHYHVSKYKLSQFTQNVYVFICSTM